MQTNNEERAGWLFVTPWIIGVFMLFGYPFFASLYWSFCEYDLLSAPRPVGFKNYAQLAKDAASFGPMTRSLWNTLYYAALAVPGSVILGVGLAVVLMRLQRGAAFWRAAVYLPSVLPTVATAVLWMWLLDPRDGLVNQAMRWIGLGENGWTGVPLGESNWFRGTEEALWPTDWWSGGFLFGSKDGLVLMTLWASGNWIIIYLAALHSVPKALYEAASLDGAGPLRRFWHVTLPMLSPVIFFNVVMGLIQSFTYFTPVYIVSEGTGQPGGATLLISLQMFLSAFQDLRMGMTSAVAWVLFVLLAGLTGLLFRTSRYWVRV
ncbi:MAG: sugar ABC transporter permease [Planctomycetota bacterium]